MSSNMMQWGKDVKKALIDKEYTIKHLAKEVGVCATTVSALINGRYAKKDYLEIGEKINSILGITRLPEKPVTPSEDWCKTVKKAMIDHDMQMADLAEATGFSRDKVCRVLNGYYIDELVVKKINERLGITYQ